MVSWCRARLDADLAAQCFLVKHVHMPPLDFDEAFRAATRLDVAPGVEAVFVGYDDLVRLKRRAGRPSDLADIEHLKAIRSERQGD